MARLHFAALLVAAALVVASGTRVPLQAAAPAPAASNGADVLFTMEAQQATFTDDKTLTLSGLTGSAQSFAVGGKTAVYPIAAFTGSQFVNAAGEWLGNPQAVFYGVNAQGNLTTVVLALSSPKVSAPAAGVTNNNNNNNNGGTITNNNNNGETLSFTVAAVPADAAKVKMPGGAVSAKIAEAASGAGDLATTITPAAQFTNVVLFMDSNQAAVQKTAETKWGWGGWFPNYYNNGYNGYNGGWTSNNNNNNNNNNGGWGAVNNNNNNNNNGGGGANNNNNNNNNGGYGAVNNNNNNNNNGGWGANNNNNNNNNGRH